MYSKLIFSLKKQGKTIPQIVAHCNNPLITEEFVFRTLRAPKIADKTWTAKPHVHALPPKKDGWMKKTHIACMALPKEEFEDYKSRRDITGLAKKLNIERKHIKNYLWTYYFPHSHWGAVHFEHVNNFEQLLQKENRCPDYGIIALGPDNLSLQQALDLF